jgi:RNA polymerase sigma factor (sigma-70 family)
MKTKEEIQEEQVLQQYDKLIMKLAHKVHRSYNGKYSLDDIVQEAKISAIRAFRIYDPSKKTKLITHLYNYINFYLSHFTRADTGLIKIPKVTNVEASQLPEIIDSEAFQANYVNERCPVQSNISDDMDNKMFIEESFSILSKKEQDILKLVYIDGYTYNEVADMYNVSRQYANALAIKAIKKLQDKYIENI